ncbi:unnamed protein product, partial [Heterosigma akashiwo]
MMLVPVQMSPQSAQVATLNRPYFVMVPTAEGYTAQPLAAGTPLLLQHAAA